MEQHVQPCALCLFCEEVGADHIRCTNADVGQDSGWEETYMMQGYLDLPLFRPGQEPCFWFVQRR
jgi:hypothetical protein